MTQNYCLLGKSNKCYEKCSHLCNSNSKYYLEDRMKFKFRVIPDNIDTTTTIYNSKITSISPNDVSNSTSYRIDIIDENIDDIKTIINKIKNRERLEGTNYTSGNLNRLI